MYVLYVYIYIYIYYIILYYNIYTYIITGLYVRFRRCGGVAVLDLAWECADGRFCSLDDGVADDDGGISDVVPHSQPHICDASGPASGDRRNRLLCQVARSRLSWVEHRHRPFRAIFQARGPDPTSSGMSPIVSNPPLLHGCGPGSIVEGCESLLGSSFF